MYKFGRFLKIYCMPGVCVSEHYEYDSYTHHDWFGKAVILAYHAEGQAKELISCG